MARKYSTSKIGKARAKPRAKAKAKPSKPTKRSSLAGSKTAKWKITPRKAAPKPWWDR